MQSVAILEILALPMDTGGMFDWSYFDNSEVIMSDNWNVLFFKKNIFIVETDIITI
jgi:hypothetical protein